MDIYLYAGTHPIGYSLLRYPPEGVDYTSNMSIDQISFNNVYGKSNVTKRNIYRDVTNFFNMPRQIWIPTKCDIIHTTRSFLVMNKKPWITTLEHVIYLDGGIPDGKPGKEPIKSKIKKRILSKHCKGILPFSNASKKSFEHIFKDPELTKKLTVVYPAIEKIKETKGEVDYPIKLLFIGEFNMKGGRDIIDSLDHLTFDYRLDMIITRDGVPFRYKKKIINNENINLIEGTIPREKLFDEYYAKSDVFLFPTYIDTFGYVVLEAMAHGLPVIGSNHFAVSEMVQNNINGYTIDPLYTSFDENYQYKGREDQKNVKHLDNGSVVDNLSDRLNKLGNNPKLIKKMGDESLRLIDEKFSIDIRNKKLLDIYQKALE